MGKKDKRIWTALAVILGTLIGCGSDVLVEAPPADHDAPAGGDYDPPRIPLPEVCNGIDDDLDGDVDEGVVTPSCSTLPATAHWRYAYGDCKRGTNLCIDGGYECVGEILPKTEICDDEAQDEDCDGEVNEGLETPQAVDFIVVWDSSESMCGFHDEAACALDAFAAIAVDARFAWVDASMRGYGPLVQTRHDFMPAPDTSWAVCDGYYQEGTLNAIEMIADPENPLGLSFKPGALVIVLVFSDEYPQYYPYTSSSPHAGEVGTYINGFVDEIHIWNRSGRNEWLRVLDQTEGQYYYLSECREISRKLGEIDTWRCP